MEEIKLPDATARKSGSTPDNGRKASIFRKSSRLPSMTFEPLTTKQNLRKIMDEIIAKADLEEELKYDAVSLSSSNNQSTEF